MDIDLEKFFDNVPHDMLMSLVHKLLRMIVTQNVCRLNYMSDLYGWLTFRESGPEFPCRWFYVTEIYKDIKKQFESHSFFEKTEEMNMNIQ